MSGEFKPIRLACSSGPDIHFDGRVVAEFTTQKRDGTKDRWTELRLWETRGGNWVAEKVGCSTRGNEREIRDADVIDTPDLAHKAMEVWGWSSVAKAFARQLGWDVVRRVD